ncbi:MAG: Rieske (2Fe-2S) protein [Acidobacteriota bacterium]|nr:Rieske (2Fe-2S) protein [Acidobacteriota bacterium]
MASKRDRYRSRYTLDNKVPGAFEGETMTRRRFMTGTAHTAGAVAAASFSLPALGFALAPVFEAGKHRWEVAGPVDDFPDNNYIPVVVTVTPDLGEVGKTTVYVRRHNPSLDTDPYDRNPAKRPFIAISNRCAHAGCPVRWVEAAERFICPCHGGVYDILGKRVGGPPPRPLDRFQTRVTGGQVEIGPRYSVNSELRPFSPRGPGEPVDGIGQYLYPSQFDERK